MLNLYASCFQINFICSTNKRVSVFSSVIEMHLQFKSGFNENTFLCEKFSYLTKSKFNEKYLNHFFTLKHKSFEIEITFCFYWLENARTGEK